MVIFNSMDNLPTIQWSKDHLTKRIIDNYDNTDFDFTTRFLWQMRDWASHHTHDVEGDIVFGDVMANYLLKHDRLKLHYGIITQILTCISSAFSDESYNKLISALMDYNYYAIIVDLITDESFRNRDNDKIASYIISLADVESQVKLWCAFENKRENILTEVILQNNLSTFRADLEMRTMASNGGGSYILIQISVAKLFDMANISADSPLRLGVIV